MKYHLSFIAIMLSVAGISLCFLFGSQEHNFFRSHEARNEVESFIKDFRATHTPVNEINFAHLYGGSGQFQVLYPWFGLQVQQAAGAERTCDQRNTDLAIAMRLQDINAGGYPDARVHASQTKFDQLEHLLNEGVKLPEDFITTPPFVDEYGHSYAYLIARKVHSADFDRTWVEQHLSFFKVSELKEILDRFKIESPIFSIIAKLNDSEVEEVVRGAEVVLLSDYVLLKDQSQLGFSPLSYQVYKIQDLNQDLANAKNALLPIASGAFCLDRIGNACWTYSSTQAMKYLQQYSLAIVALLAVVFCLFLFLYLRYLFEKNQEQKRNRLSLQVLSHEFRTPVSSMLLLIEQLTENQTRLANQDQDLITRMSVEVYRLQRIIEVSRTYLQAEGKTIPFKKMEIASINDWIADFILESDFKIEYQPLEEDQGIVADPFWLKYVLMSLVQNAFAHGAEPVRILLQTHKGRLRITVQDHGQCEFTSLSQMTQPFVKSARSQGMGLGLNITKFIVDEWGGEIQFSPLPTSFTLTMDNPLV